MYPKSQVMFKTGKLVAEGRTFENHKKAEGSRKTLSGDGADRKLGVGGGRRRGEARSRERGGNHGKRERGGHKISRRTVGGSLAIREAVTRQEWERAARK